MADSIQATNKEKGDLPKGIEKIETTSLLDPENSEIASALFNIQSGITGIAIRDWQVDGTSAVEILNSMPVTKITLPESTGLPVRNIFMLGWISEEAIIEVEEPIISTGKYTIKIKLPERRDFDEIRIPQGLNIYSEMIDYRDSPAHATTTTIGRKDFCMPSRKCLGSSFSTDHTGDEQRLIPVTNASYVVFPSQKYLPEITTQYPQLLAASTEGPIIPAGVPGLLIIHELDENN